VAERGVLEKPYHRVDIIRALAEGKTSRRELADKYGCSTQAIDQFADRHRDRIQAVAADLQNEYAGIFYAQQRNRVAMLAEQIDYVAELLEDPERQARAGVSTAEMLRAAQSAARNVAEELGQLPARGIKHEGGVSVRYVIEGVDPDAYA
jgi:transposase-like protein